MWQCSLDSLQQVDVNADHLVDLGSDIFIDVHTKRLLCYIYFIIKYEIMTLSVINFFFSTQFTMFYESFQHAIRIIAMCYILIYPQ